MNFGKASSHLLDCPICLQEYNGTNQIPKILSCGHSGCFQCLDGQVSSCPICRKSIQSKDQENLVTNFSLLQIIESHQEKNKCCLKHPSYQLDHVCLEDRSLICLYCSIYESHKGHDVTTLKDFQTEVESALQIVEEKFSKFDLFFENDIKQLKSNVVDKYSQIINKITEKMNETLQQIDEHFQDENRLKAEILHEIEDLNNSMVQGDQLKMPNSKMVEASIFYNFEELEIKLEKKSSEVYLQIDELKKIIESQFFVEENGKIEIHFRYKQKFLGLRVHIDDTIKNVQNKINLLYPELNDTNYKLIYNHKILKGSATISDYNIQSFIPLELKYCAY